MQIIRYPKRKDWNTILQRPIIETKSLQETVSDILRAVHSTGDRALYEFTEKFDHVSLGEIKVTEDEIEIAKANVPPELKRAINQAKSNIEKFHLAQVENVRKIETTEGVQCWRKSVAIEKVGLYVPAGTAPLFSTVLMLAIPAKIAGCREIIVCSPPDLNGKIDDVIIYTSAICGVTKLFRIGGIQAIGAMAFGTESVPKVYKIFGPGNQYVTAAKQFVTQFGTAIDMPAGPSEVAVFADETAIPEFVAADLLSQAEHGRDSQVLLVSTSESVIEKSIAAIDEQLSVLPRREIAEDSIKNSKAIVVRNDVEAIDILNEYAAEHLILAVEKADEIAEQVINAGSVFIGNYSCESAGDYATGTNHTLPTNGYAKNYSGVSLDSFVKKITFQKLSETGVLNLGKTIEIMAEAEQLQAHKNAISVRLRKIAASVSGPDTPDS